MNFTTELKGSYGSVEALAAAIGVVTRGHINEGLGLIRAEAVQSLRQR